MSKTIREHPQSAILETCDFWGIWSEWWEDMTWPTKNNCNKRKDHSENTKQDEQNYRENDDDNDNYNDNESEAKWQTMIYVIATVNSCENVDLSGRWAESQIMTVIVTSRFCAICNSCKVFL